MSRLTDLPEWTALAEHHAAIRDLHMRDQFAAEPDRFGRFSLQLDDILFDYSKNRVTRETMRLLCDLARQASLQSKIEAMFTGQKVNNGVISMAYPGDGSELLTSLEIHQSAGRATGLVTTTTMTSQSIQPKPRSSRTDIMP